AGPGANVITVSGGDTQGVFAVQSVFPVSVTATISGLTISHGLSGSGGGISQLGSTLTVSDCVVRDNAAAIFGFRPLVVGGGIANDGGTLTVINSAVVNNRITVGFICDGGGIYSHSFGPLTLINTTVIGNQVLAVSAVSRVGGGIY